MPPEDTVTTRAGAAARSTGSSSLVSANGAITCPATVSSIPARFTA